MIKKYILIVCFVFGLLQYCLATDDIPVCNLSAREQKVFDLINKERTKKKLFPLHCNMVLQVIAKDQSVWMAVHKDFGHDRKNGLTFLERANLIKSRYNRSIVGENLAWGNFGNAGLVAGWMKSEHHRDNILTAKFCDTGISYYKGYWTQVFGCEK